MPHAPTETDDESDVFLCSLRFARCGFDAYVLRSITLGHSTPITVDIMSISVSMSFFSILDFAVVNGLVDVQRLQKCDSTIIMLETTMRAHCLMDIVRFRFILRVGFSPAISTFALDIYVGKKRLVGSMTNMPRIQTRNFSNETA